jgi:hypothetical protein
MAGFRIEGNTSGNVAEVDAADAEDTRNAQIVNLAKSLARAGYAVQMNENDDGTVTGTPYLKSPEVDGDWRQRASHDMLLLSEQFNATTQNSSVFAHILTTMTLTYAAGFASLNASAITTTTTGAMLKTYRVMPIYGSAQLYIEIQAMLTQVPQTNNIVEIGAFIAGAVTTAMTDGVAFRYDSTGVLKGVFNYNGSETFTAAMTAPSANVVHKYSMSIGVDAVEFWIDDVLQATLTVPAGVGSPFSAGSMPIAARVYNSGVPALAQVVKVSQIFASIGGWLAGKPWSHCLASAGLSAVQGANGMTQGQTANYANSAAPASATLANATAGYATLGGQFQFAAVAGAETDYALFAFLVPAGTVAITGRTLHITGVSIDTFNSVVAVATTATVMQWAMAVGCTAVTLATAEAVNAKAPRRIPLGIQTFPVGATVGAAAVPVIANWTAPLCVNAGEYVHIILKMPIGTATATEIFRGTVRIEAYWE